MGGPKVQTFEVLWEAAGAIAFENLPTNKHLMLMGAGAVARALSHGAKVTLGSPRSREKVSQPG